LQIDSRRTIFFVLYRLYARIGPMLLTSVVLFFSRRLIPWWTSICPHYRGCGNGKILLPLCTDETQGVKVKGRLLRVYFWPHFTAPRNIWKGPRRCVAVSIISLRYRDWNDCHWTYLARFFLSMLDR
jgi:hypothetical protein